jgi:predicted RNase H-like HicB family nuclease
MMTSFQVIIAREGQDYVARCPEVSNAVARGHSTQDALEKLKAIIQEKFRPDEESGDGTAPVPEPVFPPSRGPGAAKDEPIKPSDS